MSFFFIYIDIITLSFIFLLSIIIQLLFLLYNYFNIIDITYYKLIISVTVSIGNIGSGYLIGKYGYVERYMRTGGFTLIISSYMISFFGVNSPYIFEFFVIALSGLSVGLNMQNCVLVTQQSSAKKCKYY